MWWSRVQAPAETFQEYCCAKNFQAGVLLTNKRIVALESRGTVGRGRCDYQQTSYFLGVRTTGLFVVAVQKQI